MKKYKLLIESPQLPKGSIAQDDMSLGERYYYDIYYNNMLIVSSYPKITIEDRPEVWEEIVEEKKKVGRWRAERGMFYSYIDDEGALCTGIEGGDSIDNYRYIVNNYHQTKEQVQKYLNYTLALATVRNAILEANDGWVPDWGDEKMKYNFYYNNKERQYRVESCWSSQEFFIFPHMKNNETAQQIIKDYTPHLDLIREYQKNNY